MALVVSALFVFINNLYIGVLPPNCPEDCVVSAHYASQDIHIDGLLDEDAWSEASVATGFTQYSPNEGDTATQQTEVRILYGKNQIFISAVLHDTEPEQIRRTLGRRDEFNQADWFIASIDSYFDRKTAYNFAVNAAGVQADGIYTGNRGPGGDGGFDFDTSWDAVWRSAVRSTPEGWVVEMRIPFTMLRFSDAATQRWGINFRRVIPRLGEISDWVLIPRSERSSGTVAQYGILEGLSELRPRRNVQIAPYTVGNAIRDSEASTSSLTGDIGVDLKVGLSSNITLDATINPDFGQVEADPAELNLTAFETFFPEKRPFFTEGVAVFNYRVVRGGSLLYTRRVGSKAAVIGAGKLSGRTENGLDFGFFGASTGDNFKAENHYGVGRVKQRIGNLSSIGGIATFFDGVHGDRSYTGGTDWDIRILDNQYSLSGQFSATHHTEESESEQGFAFSFDVDRQRSIWNFSTDIAVISDGYNPNAIGRLRQNNYVNFSAGVAHQVNGGQPFGPFRRASAFLFLAGGFSYDKQLHDGFGSFFFSDWTLQGYDEIELNIFADYLFGGYNEFETRGLDARARPQEVQFDVEYRTDTRKKWIFEPSLEGTIYADGGQALTPELELLWTATPKLDLSVEVSVSRERNTVEWAANEALYYGASFLQIGQESNEDPSEVEYWSFVPEYLAPSSVTLNNIFSVRKPWDEQGNHYLPVFGHRDTRSADITLRTGITLSPSLSIQFYGQLFAARGQYNDIEVLQDRDTLVPVTAWPKRYDFAFSRLQTNTVARWEYRPGSTLYVVWSQSRSTNDEEDFFDLVGRSPFDQSTSNQLVNTFDLPPVNALLIKFSYKFLN
ncbi:MAG: DUF5916 domain-containing protein [Bacteroidetes bacterium]|nr:DUF5916 domain-containing protein [Bacteroidota bacterium]MCY4204784.1 DUF5916 domain-containing protein [Bacteroidota bacterium]